MEFYWVANNFFFFVKVILKVDLKSWICSKTLNLLFTEDMVQISRPLLLLYRSGLSFPVFFFCKSLNFQTGSLYTGPVWVFRFFPSVRAWIFKQDHYIPVRFENLVDFTPIRPSKFKPDRYSIESYYFFMNFLFYWS